MMKRIGRDASIVGKVREICNMDADELDVELEDSGGTYAPPSRKDLIFDNRSSDDAEGERRMMGSGRRAGAFGLWGRGLFAREAAA